MKINRSFLGGGILFFVLSIYSTSIAKAGMSHGGNPRASRKLGIQAGIQTNPMPSLWSFNLAYNLFSWFQIHGGYGSLSMDANGSDTSGKVADSVLGGGAKLFIPGHYFSPYVGVHIARNMIAGGAHFTYGSVSGAGTFTQTYASFGFDLQTNRGFNIGTSCEIGVGGVFAGVIMPGFYLGWFF